MRSDVVSHRRTSTPGRSAAARVTVLSAAATAAATLTAGAAVADPEAGRTGTARNQATARLDALYEKAERATEAYNGATERTARLRGEVSRLQDRLARSQERLNRLRGRLGLIASAQYRSGALVPTVQLVLARDPEAFLESASALDRLAGSQAAQLRAVRSVRRTLDQQRQEATATLDELAASRRQVGRVKKDVERKLATARRLLKAMSPAARAAYDRSSRGGERPEGLPGLLSSAGAPVDGRAAAAVAAVESAIGRPYAWGRSGPTAFDCSGLTQWAYARAGVWLPRTSQEQRHAGHQVPLSQARPGDLVIYRDDASHVGMYVGHGRVVHAPYPGARVRYDPVGMMPIAAVTRP